MRMIVLLELVAFAAFPSIAFAQTDTSKPQGYTGAYGPPGPAAPYYKGPLPEVDTGPGRTIVEPDGSTKSVKAAPCGTAARETDGITTCIGIPDKSLKGR
jgi:hypothetical protein